MKTIEFARDLRALLQQSKVRPPGQGDPTKLAAAPDKLLVDSFVRCPYCGCRTLPYQTFRAAIKACTTDAVLQMLAVALETHHEECSFHPDSDWQRLAKGLSRLEECAKCGKQEHAGLMAYWSDTPEGDVEVSLCPECSKRMEELC